MNTKACSNMGLSQFELSKLTLKNLNKFELSPTAKLVLLALIDCYNPANAEIYPKQETISEHLGISLSSVKRAIKELANAQLIIYITKNTNRYKMTSKFFELVNLTPEQAQNDTSQSVNLTPAYIEQKKEQKKNSKVFSFSSFSNDRTKKPYYHNNQSSGINYKPFKAPENIRDDKSPYTDKDTAVKWLATLTENELKHGFIKSRAEKIKKFWKI
jgi:DNA-binding MarR family transcriptional regulator